jgi:hypothetical protein
LGHGTKSSQSAFRVSGKQRPGEAGGEKGGSIGSSLPNINEGGDDSQMQKIKAEFVEYVKEILTTTSSSQVGGPA